MSQPFSKGLVVGPLLIDEIMGGVASSRTTANQAFPFHETIPIHDDLLLVDRSSDSFGRSIDSWSLDALPENGDDSETTDAAAVDDAFCDLEPLLAFFVPMARLSASR